MALERKGQDFKLRSELRDSNINTNTTKRLVTLITEFDVYPELQNMCLKFTMCYTDGCMFQFLRTIITQKNI